MNEPAAPSNHPSLWIVLLSVCALIGGCTQTPLSAPTTGLPERPNFASKSLGNRVDVKLRLGAVLLNDPDRSVMVTVQARCPTGFSVVEAPVTLSQGPVGSETHGEGFFTLPCNGRWQVHTVRVVAPEGMVRGTANASASLDVEDPATGEFLQDSDRRVVRIR